MALKNLILLIVILLDSVWKVQFNLNQRILKY